MRDDGSDSVRARRLLVVATETCVGDVLFDEMRYRAGTDGDVLVVVPALAGRAELWADDLGRATAAARVRLDASLAAGQAAGLRAHGEIGDPDPLQALDDAVAGFRPDEAIVVTHPADSANWLERGLVRDARARFADLPISHVAVHAGAAWAEGVAPEREPPPARDGHPLLVLALTFVVVVLSPLLWILGGATGWASWGLTAFAVAADLVVKLAWFAFLSARYLWTPRHDRLGG